MSLQVSYKKQVLFFFMLVLVFFAVLEVILSTYEYFNPRCDFLTNPVSKDYDYDFKKQTCEMWKVRQIYIDPITGISQMVPNQHFQTLNINSYGFRGPEIQMEKPDDTYRIFVVGGSTTFGIRSLGQETIPGYLQQNLDALNFDKKIEVINGGIGALTSSDELQLLKTKILKFEPDLIVIYDGNNDAVNFPGKTKNKRYDDALTYVWKKHLSFFMTPYVIGGIQADIKRSISMVILDVDFAENAQVWKKNMISVCEMGKQQGFDTIVILQPFLGTGNKTLSDFEKENMEQIYSQFTTDTLIGYQYFADELKDLENYCTITADYRKAFDAANTSIYYDRVHVGPEGNKIIADNMVDFVVPIINE